MDLFPTAENTWPSVVINAWLNRSTGDGQPEPFMALCYGPCIPAAFPQATVCSGTLGGPELATETMDGGDLQDAGGSLMASSSQMGHAITGAGQDMAPGSPYPETSCMALERQRLCSLRLKREVVDTLHALQARSTQLQYNGKCRVFRTGVILGARIP